MLSGYGANGCFQRMVPKAAAPPSTRARAWQQTRTTLGSICRKRVSVRRPFPERPTRWLSLRKHTWRFRLQMLPPSRDTRAPRKRHQSPCSTVLPSSAKPRTWALPYAHARTRTAYIKATTQKVDKALKRDFERTALVRS